MGFGNLPSRRDYLPVPAAFHRDGYDLILQRDLGSPSSVVEFSSGNPRLAELLLREKLAHCRFTALCPVEGVANLHRERLKGHQDVEILTADFSSPLPLEPACADLLLCAYLLEHLPMDFLYMALSEARRLLPPGGRWLILSRSEEEKGLARLVSFAQKWKRVPMIRMHHFLSPEDWAIVSDESVGPLSFRSRLLVLERMPG